uniref:UDP-glucuronosyltransferase n=1 Tax=Saccoglossus kowalevskii TaxID=10224 RepID=A0ABM0MIP4_SACKO|nr:PREDICTED: 2-hydroxyacylsphingosine 1-beta-galactosyltransferase-like [Saccoglossus kowalevskii]
MARFQTSRDLLLLTLMYVLLGSVFCHKVLILPGISVGSHFLYFAKLGEHLKSKCLDVTMMLGENNNDLNKIPHIVDSFHFEKYTTAIDNTLMTNLGKMITKSLNGEFNPMNTMIINNALVEDCVLLLKNEELFQRLQRKEFDIILINPIAACTILMSQKLDLPFVIVSTNRPFTMMDAYYLNMPSPISYVPSMMSGLSDNMNVGQRLRNLIYRIIGHLMYRLLFLAPYDELKLQFGIKPEMDMMTSSGRSEITLFAVDWALETPRPIMSNTIFLGGLLASPQSPLTNELVEFMESARHGVVILSFGSTADLASCPEKAALVCAGLARLPQKVIMKYNGPPPTTLGNNTKLTKWMPQNDLLGHPNTKAFVTHGGMNGVYEAIYHAVPIVGFPLYGDHYDTFSRVSSKGMAVILNIGKLTPDELYNAVIKVINTPSYKENAKKISAIHKDKPMSAGDTAVFWIEYVIKHGGQHLRAEAFNLSFIEYFQIDIAVSLLVVISVICFVIKKV